MIAEGKKTNCRQNSLIPWWKMSQFLLSLLTVPLLCLDWQDETSQITDNYMMTTHCREAQGRRIKQNTLEPSSISVKFLFYSCFFIKLGNGARYYIQVSVLFVVMLLVLIKIYCESMSWYIFAHREVFLLIFWK